MEMKNQMVAELVAMGITKYRIAKECNVSWNTVQNWARGIFTPNTITGINLIAFYNKMKEASLCQKNI